MKRILFVCTGNTCRSPMAQALFNWYAKEYHTKAISSSAGIFAQGEHASDGSIKAMQRRGIDISNHHPTQISASQIEQADIVLTMTNAHKAQLLQMGAPSEKVFTLYEYIGKVGDVSDPYGGHLEVYQKTADELELMIKEIFQKGLV